jgi:glycerol kinase
MMARYILGIDEGTSLTKAVIFDHNARIVASGAREIQCYFPQPGWVEQDPDEILSATLKAVEEAFKNSRITPDDIEAIGISNQLMTTIFWNKNTGEAVGRAIVWSDDRSLPICERLSSKDQAGIEARSGVHIFPNSSATKIRWLMEHDRAIQNGLSRGELLYGTVDTWLIWKLSGGAVHVTDLSNAGLSLLLNIQTLSYDEWMVNELNIPYEILPKLHSSSEIYTYTKPEVFFGARLPISGDAGDQFAAIFGQACFQPGSILCNLGTGSSLTLNMGTRFYPPISGMHSPVLWAINGEATRGMGSWTNVSGAAIQWFRDELGIIRDNAEAEVLASRVPNSLGVYFVPAFAGLGSPYHDPYARGTFFGITQGTSKNHLIRAALEAMVYQVRDSFEIMKNISGMNIEVLHAGGGAARNEFLLQFMADILAIPVIRPIISESSVLGAAFLAGLATGYWETLDEVQTLVQVERRFESHLPAEQREELYNGWKKAIKRSVGWLKE